LRISMYKKKLFRLNMTDYFHIAATSVRNLDFIVGLNFRHIVKQKTILTTKVVNIRKGYKEVVIFPLWR
jgi:hypothetical protein